jgi:hypothetical protein
MGRLSQASAQHCSVKDLMLLQNGSIWGSCLPENDSICKKSHAKTPPLLTSSFLARFKGGRLDLSAKFLKGPTGCATKCSSSVNWLENILLFLSCFHKDEVFLSLDQKRARALNGLVKPFQSNVHLVAHPVGRSGGKGSLQYVYLDTTRLLP